MIIDHETMTEMGPTDETVPLRVIEPVRALVPQSNSGGNGGDYKPWPMPDDGEGEDVVPQVDFPTLEKKMATATADRKPTLAEWAERKYPERWAEFRRGWSYRYVPSVTGRNVHGDPSPLLREQFERFAKTAPIEDVVLAVQELSTEHPRGVERGSSDDTSTFALPAVWKMTGKPSAHKLAHRAAAHVQQIFNQAGWNIAVWFGEYTKTYWVMDETGLHEFDTVTAMYQGMGWEEL